MNTVAEFVSVICRLPIIYILEVIHASEFALTNYSCFVLMTSSRKKSKKNYTNCIKWAYSEEVQHHIGEVFGSNRGPTTAILIEVLRVFLQSLRASTGIIYLDYNMTVSFQILIIHLFLIILFDAI